jgi:hypothetical protein
VATIDGTTIYIRDIKIDSVQDNILTNILGSDSNNISNAGMEGLVITLQAWAATRVDYDAVMAKIMQEGEIPLIVDSGWQYNVHSNTKSVRRMQGTVDFFPFTVRLFTIDPYEYSTSDTTRTKTISSNGQEWSADNSANDIDTDGNAPAEPDISVSSTGADEEFFAQTSKFP